MSVTTKPVAPVEW